MVSKETIGNSYVIYDNQGRLALSGKINSENTTIELSGLSAGLYLFSLGEKWNQPFNVVKE
jgi:hypothetical protein